MRTVPAALWSWSEDEAKNLALSAIDMVLEQLKPSMRMYGVPDELTEKVFARCRAEGKTNYAGDFAIQWMRGQRIFPELEVTV